MIHFAERLLCLTLHLLLGILVTGPLVAIAISEQPAVRQDPVPLYPIEQMLLTELNEVRAKHDRPPVVIDADLQRTTREHCIWMAGGGGLRHSRGRTEIIAVGPSTAEGATRMWMGSPPHRSIMLGKSYTRCGVAGYRSERGTDWWCEQFR